MRVEVLIFVLSNLYLPGVDGLGLKAIIGFP